MGHGHTADRAGVDDVVHLFSFGDLLLFPAHDNSLRSSWMVFFPTVNGQKHVKNLYEQITLHLYLHCTIADRYHC
jgi:hypothetical protein